VLGEIFLILLEAFHLSKSYGDNLLFEIPRLAIHSGDKIGIFGANGAGKTTLMNLLAGKAVPDSGGVKHYCDFAYIEQFSDDAARSAGSGSRLSSELLPRGEIHSGGERTRLRIVGAMEKNCPLLLADEPTANLDAAAVARLTVLLEEAETVILISHDRALLNCICTRILEINNGKITFYDGNYDAYAAQTDEERQRERFLYEQYVSEKNRLIDAAAQAQAKAKSLRKTPKRMGNSEARLHKRSVGGAQEKLHNSSKAIVSRIERLEHRERPCETPKIRLDFSRTDPPANKIIISSRGLRFEYGEKMLFDKACFEIPNRAKVLLSGINGAGKTTLMELIDRRHSDIHVVPKARIGFFRQGFENLDMDKTVLENAMKHSVQRESIVRSVLARLLFGVDDVRKSAAVLSGGEKIKLSLASLIVSDVNVLLLDEPTNYLDIPAVEAVQDVLREYEGTLLLVSHDSEFAGAVTDRRLNVGGGKVELVTGLVVAKSDGAQRMVMEMRRTRILSEMSLAGADKEALEAEYLDVMEKLK